jgi:integrase
MSERGIGRVFQPTRKCLRCEGAGCGRCKSGRRRIETWYVQYSHRNKQYRESSGSTKRSDAVRFLKKRLAEIGGPRKFLGPQAERTTFEDLCQMIRDDYKVNGRKSTRRLETSIDRLREFFAGYRCVEITTDVVTHYIKSRIEGGRAASTVRNETNTLRRALRLAHLAERITHVPHFPRIEVGSPRTGFFEPREFAAVLAALPEPIQPIAEFAYLTGWRLGEILGLRWSQVDFDAGVVRLEVGTTKNNDGRVLPFRVLPALKALLERQLDSTRVVEKRCAMIVPRVFHRGGREIRNFGKAWNTACRRAGCEERVFHDFRRTAVRNLERAGVPRSIAMKITGHKTEAIYRRYAIVNEADMAEGLERLARFLAGGAGVRAS